MEKYTKMGVSLVILVVVLIVMATLLTVTITTLASHGGVLEGAKKEKEIVRYQQIKDQYEAYQIDREVTFDEFLSKLVQDNLITEAEKQTILSTGKITIAEKEIVF